MMTGSVEDISQNLKRDKWLRNLEDDMKPLIPYLENGDVTDIAIGREGQVIVEGFGMGKQFLPIYINEATVTRIIYASAAILDVNIDRDNPIVEGVLPNWKVRIEGILPPRSENGPVLFIRRPAARIFSLEEYVEAGRMTQQQYDLLVEHIKRRSNIMIGGETGSGKTTLLNAIIKKMAEFTPDDRFYIVEDAGEIQCEARDTVRINASGNDCLTMVGVSLRCNVSRIIFGELRYGNVTNELLKAWNTGHSGNASTIHCNSCLSMLARIRELLREVIIGQLPDITESIQLLVHLIPTEKGPKVNEMVETDQLKGSGSSFIETLEKNKFI